MSVKAVVWSQALVQGSKFLLLFTGVYISDTAFLPRVQLIIKFTMRKMIGTQRGFVRVFLVSLIYVSQEDQHVENSFPHDVRDLDGSACLLIPCGPTRVWPLIRSPASAAMAIKSPPLLLSLPFTAKNGCNSCHIQLTDLSRHVKGRDQNGEGEVRTVSQKGKCRALCQRAYSEGCQMCRLPYRHPLAPVLEK